MKVRRFVERRYVGSAIALVSGALLVFAFAPFGWWPTAVLMPACLMLLWDGASPRRAALLGFWFSFGTFAAGTYWLYISLRLIADAPVALALFLMLGLAAIMGSYHALVGWFVAKFLPPRGALRWMLGIPGAWLLIEWWRSWFLTGFGWFALGYAHTDNWLGNFTPVIGQYGLGLLTLLLAGGVAALVLGTNRARIVAVSLVTILFAAGFALRDVHWTRPNGDPISVAIVQGATPQNEKLLRENIGELLDNYRVLTHQAHGADLIVWPESTIPEPINYHVDFLREIYQEASAQGSALMLGAIRMEPNPRTGENEYFNSVLAMDSTTPDVGWHDKHHLVPFTEFLPVPEFIRSWLKLMGLPYSSFHRGPAVPSPLEAAGQRIIASVCFEDAYGATQLRSLLTATLLVNVTNDSWFGRSTARYQHLQITRLRAREAGRFIVRAANDGVSAVIDVRGEIQAVAPEYLQSVLRASVQPYTGLTPYARIGNWPVILLAFVFVGVSACLGAYQGRGGPR